MQVITANPKTAGVARWNFLALWGHKMGRGDRAAQDYCRQVSRGTTTFALHHTLLCAESAASEGASRICITYDKEQLVGKHDSAAHHAKPAVPRCMLEPILGDTGCNFASHAESRKPHVQVFEHVPVQPRDAREASDVFYKQKTGDALLTYENEVIVTNESMAPSKRLPYVVPQYNISVRLPLGPLAAGLLTSRRHKYKTVARTHSGQQHDV